jgi:hypothetical protein
MKGLDHHYSDTDDDFEDRLRAMLRRRAADVHAEPPDWQDLLDRSNAVVVSLETRRPLDGPFRARRRRWAWLRPALAAAACLSLVMAAGIAIGRSTDRSDSGGSADQSSGPASEGEQTLAAAGSESFRPATAAPLYPADTDAQLQAELDDALATAEGAEQAAGTLGGLEALANPETVATDYLASVGIEDGSPYTLFVDTPVDADHLDDIGGGSGRLVATTTVWWSLRDDPVPSEVAEADGTNNPPIITMGYVHLRDLISPAAAPEADGIGRDAWVVVGAATRGLNIADVRRDGDQIHFAVTTYQGYEPDYDTTDLPVQVEVNDQVISDGSLEPWQPHEFTASVPADEAATIRLQQFGEGQPLSVAETKFLPASDSTDGGSSTDPMPPTAPTPGEGSGRAILGDGCAPDLSLMLTLDLPSGFGATAHPGDGSGGEDRSGACAVHFADPSDSGRTIVVGWGEPAFPVYELSGPMCFPWGAVDDGGLVAVRSAPFPIYVFASGVSHDDFQQAISSSVLSGSEDWTADEGC